MKEALNLVWRTFLEYEAPDYIVKGIEEFKRSLDNKQWIKELNPTGYFTVNSSPYAHEVYRHLGFVDTDTEQVVNGLRFYPMKVIL